jgi:hypothetical protein
LEELRARTQHQFAIRPLGFLVAGSQEILNRL